MKKEFSAQVLSVLLAAGFIFGQASCSRTEKETNNTAVTEAGNQGEEAYNNFRTYVEEAERDTAYAYDSSKDWNKEISDREAAYNERVAAMDQYNDSYDENRRAEIEQMKTRYSTNWENRRSTYASYGKANSMRPQLLTIDENAKDLSSLTASNIRAAYENFVKQVEANKGSYTNEDWKVVEQAWNELDDRKNAIQSELSDKDKWEIGKAKTKYLAMKNASKAANTAGNVGSEIKDGTKEGASKVGNAAEKAGSKIDNAAEKTGSTIKSTYKKAEDKIDGTNDRK